MNSIHAKKLIEIYRLGIVPNHTIANFINRNTLTERVNDIVTQMFDNNTSLAFYCGDYGSGKTHSLMYTAEQLLKKQFVVSSISISNTVHLSHIKDFYHQIMQNITIDYIGKNISFEDLFTLWLDNLKHSPDKENAQREINWVINKLSSYNEVFARVFLNYIRAILNRDQKLAISISSWLKGDSNMPASLKKSFEATGYIDDRIAMDFLKGFTELLRLMGYRGLVITIDECDAPLSLRSDIRMNNYHTIRELIDLAYQDGLTNFGMVFAITLELATDKERGFASYGALAERIDIQNWQNSKLYLLLNQMSKDNIGDIVKHILELYEINYQVTMPDLNDIISNLPQSAMNFRSTIQATIAILDAHLEKQQL